MKDDGVFKFTFNDISKISQDIGLKKPITKFGYDSSLAMHIMFSSICLKQIAPIEFISYYWSLFLTRTVLCGLLLYGINAYSTPLKYYNDSYSNNKEIEKISITKDDLQRQFDREVGLIIGEPASSASSMRAASFFYDSMDNINISPTQIFYFIGKSLSEQQDIRIDRMTWNVDDQLQKGNFDTSIISGGDILNVVVIEGVILEQQNETYRHVYKRAKNLVESLKVREDILVEPIVLPSDSISTENLSGVITNNLNVEEAESRDFSLKITWKQYSKDKFENLSKTF